jgi:fructuronate reductase
MAALGSLAGLRFVHDFVAAPERVSFIEALRGEAGATLMPPPGLSLADYRRALMVRFANRSMAHRLDQIAKDASQTPPQRLIAALVERSDAGLSSPALSLAVAGWLKGLEGRMEDGAVVIAADSHAEKARQLIGRGGSADTRVSAALTLTDIFPANMSLGSVVATEIATKLRRRDVAGALAALAAVVSSQAYGSGRRGG